eukprot:scaffold1805_cov69-Cyclotella_meneghiniana.AAC.2
MPQGSVSSRSYQWSSKTSDDFTLKNGRKRVIFCPPRVNKNEKPVTPALSLSSIPLSHSIPRGFLACLFTAPAVSSRRLPYTP